MTFNVLQRPDWNRYGVQEATPAAIDKDECRGPEFDTHHGFLRVYKLSIVYIIIGINNEKMENSQEELRPEDDTRDSTETL